MFDWADGCVLYDPLAVAIAAEPNMASFDRMAVGVETSGRLSIGQTVPLNHVAPNIDVCVDVDGPAAVESIVSTVLLN